VHIWSERILLMFTRALSSIHTHTHTHTPPHRRITITDPWLSPGIILGNASNPIKNLTLDAVVRATLPLLHSVAFQRLK
jgi:hypothetical protein